MNAIVLLCSFLLHGMTRSLLGLNPRWRRTWSFAFVSSLATCAFSVRPDAFASCEFAGFDSDDYSLAFVNITYVDPATNRLHTEKSEIGKFGRGRIDAASGLVVHVRNRNGTNNFGCDYPFENEIPNEPWIALVRRGGCQFQIKIKHSAYSNASAAVIYNDHDGNDLKKMLYNVPHMVALFITQEKGEEIAELVDNGTRVHMYITLGSYHANRSNNINRTSVLFVSISFIVLMIISLAWLVFYYVQRFRYIHAKDQLSRHLVNAAKKALAKIPVKNIKEAGGDHECCAVCIEPYKPSDTVRSLPCKHLFHKSCVDPWLLEHRTCPMCKMDILKFYGMAYAGSRESVLQIEVEENGPSSSGNSNVLQGRPGLPHPVDRPRASVALSPAAIAITERAETYFQPESPHSQEDVISQRSEAASLCGSHEPLQGIIQPTAEISSSRSQGSIKNDHQPSDSQEPKPCEAT